MVQEIFLLKALVTIFFQRSGTICAILVERIMRNFCFEFGSVVQHLIFSSGGNLCNFGTLVQMSFKDIPIFSSGGHFVQWSGTICAISVGGIMVNNQMKLF